MDRCTSIFNAAGTKICLKALMALLAEAVSLVPDHFTLGIAGITNYNSITNTTDVVVAEGVGTVNIIMKAPAETGWSFPRGCLGHIDKCCITVIHIYRSRGFTDCSSRYFGLALSKEETRRPPQT